MQPNRTASHSQHIFLYVYMLFAYMELCMFVRAICSHRMHCSDVRAWDAYDDCTQTAALVPGVPPHKFRHKTSLMAMHEIISSSL